MAENPDPPAPLTGPDSTEPSPGPALLRRQFNAERQVRSSVPDFGEQMADLTDTVRALAQHVAGEAIANLPEAGADRGGKRIKKFTRSGLPDERAQPLSSTPLPVTEPAADGGAPPPPLSAEARKPEGAEFNKNVAWPRVGQAEAAVAAGGRPLRGAKPNKKLILFGIQAVGLALLALGYLLGRGDAPAPGQSVDSNLPNVVNSGEANVDVGVSEHELDALNAALHTARTGDKKEAARQLNELAKHALVPGLEYQLGRLAFEQGDLINGDTSLDRSKHAGDFFAPACYVQARNYAGEGHSEAVQREFGYAVHADPFNARYFFYYAEALRRDGKTRKAIDFFEAARDRSHTSTEDALYLFKERLAQVEVGGDVPFNAELDAHLKEQPPRPDWLMLAAARSINAGDFPAATGFLKQAVTTAPPTVYNLWVKDFTFRAVSAQPALAELLQRSPVPDSADTYGVFLDPTVVSTELLDPGIWPVGTR